ARVRVKSTDELGRLGESFNYMISSLQEAKRALEAEHERQLEQAEKMASLGQLASAIAHEVKNPLGGVSGAMQVLAEDYPIDDPKREVIDEMLGQLRRLDKTVKDLLSYARPASPEPVACDVSDVVERALFFIRQQVRESQISVVTEYGKDLPQVHVDPQQMQQVILNIALNGVQAMPEEGTLTVRTRVLTDWSSGVSGSSLTSPGSAYVEVAISDTGKGIPPEDLKKIFQPFFTTKHRGTGLGLPICQRIVEQHGGTISVESEVGKGTTVSVRLPVQRS
ncbi:MAG: ATP-binding protein, partial [Candidatus Methylomirabilales bacterium]